MVRCPNGVESRLMKALSRDALNYFLFFSFLTDRLSDKKLSDKK